MIQWIVLHHSWSRDSQKLYDTPGIFDYHINENHWSNVGYNEIIEKLASRIYSTVGRPCVKIHDYDIGAHAHGFNTNSYGICVIGNFDLAEPDSELWEFTLDRCLVVMIEHSIPVENVIGHWETFILDKKAKTQAEAQNIKTCPGRKWLMDKFRKDLSNKYITYMKGKK